MINVFIVDDMRLHREGLANLLRQAEVINVVGAVGDLQQSMTHVCALRPDVVLLNMAMPNSTAALRMITEALPAARIVAMGVSEAEDEVIACAERGAAGFVSPEGSPGDLVAAIESVARGEMLCSPRVAAALLRRIAVLASERPLWPMRIHLTQREHEILQLVDLGLSNKEISRRLSIRVRTVKTHVHNILEKLQVRRRSEAVARVRDAKAAVWSDAHAPAMKD